MREENVMLKKPEEQAKTNGNKTKMKESNGNKTKMKESNGNKVRNNAKTNGREPKKFAEMRT